MNIHFYNKFFLSGIGGSSMSSLAEILKLLGKEVYGSDSQSSHVTNRLIRNGIEVVIGQKADNIHVYPTDVLVRSDAVSEDNPEIVEARACGVPVFRRAELLGALLSEYKTAIGVAGTHGKTTASSMITSIFAEYSNDFSAIIGGEMKRFGSSYLVGSNRDVCVFESCEYKDSFHFFYPDISVILNIAEDHMEYFLTHENLINSFKKYLKNTGKDGILVYNAEDEGCKEAICGFEGEKISFGIENGRFNAKKIKSEKGLYSFDCFDGEDFIGHINLKVAGEHNIKNALAAAAACKAYGIENEKIVRGLENFSGVKRRLEYHGEINGAVIADDYGHHPDAYKVTFKTAKELGFKRIIAIHQPHTYSRTKMLMNEFVEVLSTVDYVLIPPVYPARETDSLGICSQDIVARLENAEYCDSFERIVERINELARPGDIFITLGCGDIYKAAEKCFSD